MPFLYLRAIALIMIMFGCGFLGVFYSEKFHKRVLHLVDFQNALNTFKFNVDFLESPLYEALKNIATESSVVKKIFENISDKLRNFSNVRIDEIFKEIIHKFEEELFIKDEDVSILVEFSDKLGQGNKEHEINNINLALMKLKLSEEMAREEEKINQKLYRGIGFLVGIFIVILLV
ncbi:MAG: stage III sporulation protein AB [Clostridiales bacterium]|jgi:stage III sporulation protein AB|nr:stage III sporulation protein AB [Clostridiales bacterium]